MRRDCGPLYDNRIPFTAFPASTSNEITYEYFCLLGGLENLKCAKITRQNGSHVYFTYHLISKP